MIDDKLKAWLEANKEATGELIAGKAAVVPLTDPRHSGRILTGLTYRSKGMVKSRGVGKQYHPMPLFRARLDKAAP